MGIQIRELLHWARQRKILATLVVTLTLGIGILMGTVISGRVVATKGLVSSGATPLAIPDPVQMSSAFASIVNKVEPAVVNISTTQVIERKRGPRRPRSQEDPFQDFFDRFFDSPDQGPTAERSLGSGVIVDKKGYILTNNHVVEQATKIQVQFNGESTRYTAKVIGTDDETDLAVIKIETSRELPTAKLGNSDGVQVGDWVLAIGSPFGLQATVTAGIVSAKDRAGIGQQFQRFLQTDAAINPGNSGGPLVDMAGQVIGINTAIITGSRGYEGVGFALPSNTAINVYNQLISTGKVTRGSIGVRFTEENGTNAIVLKELGAPYGIVIEDVEPGSPAAKAGLQPGDVITSVNGNPVHKGNELVNPIAQTRVGDKVRVTYVRDHKEREATLTVEDRVKVFPDRAGHNEGQPGEATPVEFGLRVEDLTSDRARRLGIEAQRGVLVTEVQPAGFGDDIGLARGDIIVEVNHEAISSVGDYRRVLAKLKAGENVVFKVMRRADTDRMLTVFLAGVVPGEKQ
ncbi:MAG: Do family serine endopeptidase [Candidatus Acidiferrales bacterium]